MAGKSKKPQTAAEIKASLFSDAQEDAVIDADAGLATYKEESRKRIAQKVQDNPQYDVSDLARNLRSRVTVQSPIKPRVNPKDAPYRVAGEQIGETGALVRSRVTTPRKEAETRSKIRRATDILEGRVSITKKTPNITAPGVAPAEAPAFPNYGFFKQNGKRVYSDAKNTTDKISQNIVDEYFANRPAEAVNEYGQLKSSHAERELYRLNAHMAKYNVNPKLLSTKPNISNKRGILSNEDVPGPAYKLSDGVEDSPLRHLFMERDSLVARVSGRDTGSVKNLEGVGTEVPGLNWQETGPLAKVNKAGVFGLTGVAAASTPNQEKSATEKESMVRGAEYRAMPQKDSLPDSHRFVLLGQDLYIKRSFNGHALPDELVHRGTDRIPDKGGKVVSIPNFQSHRYSWSADGERSYANIGGVEQRVHSSTMHHYIVNRDETGRLTVAPHPDMPESSGGLFAVHPTTGKPVSVSESSVLPSPEVREAVGRGAITEGAGSKYENQLRPRPAAAASEPTEQDMIHNLWVKHGPGSSEAGTSLVNASHQIKQNWFNTAHKLAVKHFSENNPQAAIPSDKIGLVDNFFTKERKKAAYKRDAQKASDLGLM
jgi:hypothetical protein